MDVAIGAETGWQKRRTDAHVADCIAPGVTLFGIADGFGALPNGAPIASTALANVRDDLRRRQRGRAFGRSVSPSALRAILLGALDYANARIYAQSGSDDDYVGSGTSLTAVLIVGPHAFVGHVGDARAYVLRLGRLELLTADDAMFSGAAVSTKSSVPAQRTCGLLWRSLGTQPKLEASIAHVELVAGDQLVLCSHGVHRAVADEEIGAALGEGTNATAVVDRILSAARARNGADNVTVVVARNLLETQVPALVAGARARTVRVAVAVGLLAASLLSYGLFTLRGGFTDHPANLTSSDR